MLCDDTKYFCHLKQELKIRNTSQWLIFNKNKYWYYKHGSCWNINFLIIYYDHNTEFAKQQDMYLQGPWTWEITHKNTTSGKFPTQKEIQLFLLEVLPTTLQLKLHWKFVDDDKTELRNEFYLLSTAVNRTHWKRKISTTTTMSFN